MNKGSCLCKSVSFEVAGELPTVTACHCGMCRKITGHYEAGVDVDKSALKILDEANITWYQSSEKARRGFCKTCGSVLFFEPTKGDWIGISIGAFDGPLDTKLTKHIFVSFKADYYEINDGAEQFDLYPGA